MPPPRSEHLQRLPNVSFRQPHVEGRPHLESHWQLGCPDDSSQKNPGMQIPGPHAKQLPSLQSGAGGSLLVSSSAVAGLLDLGVVGLAVAALDPPHPNCEPRARTKTGKKHLCKCDIAVKEPYWFVVTSYHGRLIDWGIRIEVRARQTGC